MPSGATSSRQLAGPICRRFGRIGLLVLLPLLAALVPPGPDASAGTGQWSEPVKVSGRTLGGWFPDVAADDDGNVHVIWQAGLEGASGDGSRPSVQDLSALYYTHLGDGKWSQPNDIALVSPAGVALRSSIAMDGRGRLHLLYKGLGPLTSDAVGQEFLWYKSADSSNAESVTDWSRPVQVSEGQAYFSDIAIDSKGAIHVIYTESDRNSWAIYYRNSTDGGQTWSRRVPLDSANFVWWYRAQLKIDSQDRLHVVWESLPPISSDQFSGGGFGVSWSANYAISTDSGNTWSTVTWANSLGDASIPQTGYTARPSGPQQPAIGVDGDGTILLVYRDPVTEEIMFRQSKDGLLWSLAQPIPGLESGLARPYDTYDMATDSDGHVHLVAVAMPKQETPTAVAGPVAAPVAMKLLHFEWDGTKWSEPDTIASSPPYPEYPKLVIGAGNQLHVVWFSGDKPGIERTPNGIWYSTTTATSPRKTGLLGMPPLAEVARVTPVQSSATPIARTASAPTPRPLEISPRPGAGEPRWLADLQENRAYPVLAGLAAIVPMFILVTLVRRGLSRWPGFRS